MSVPLNIPDLPASVQVTNLLARTVRIPGIRDIPASATVTIPFTKRSAISEARRLRRWKNIKRAVAAGVLAYVAADAAWGTIQVTNLTVNPVSFGGLIPGLTPSEVRVVNLVDNMTVSRRVRLWKALRSAANAGSPKISIVAPSITFISITPNTGAYGSAVPVTIVGTDFVVGATVTIDGVALTGVTVVDSSHITGTTAALPGAGAFDVVVTNPDASQATGTGAYTAT